MRECPASAGDTRVAGKLRTRNRDPRTVTPAMQALGAASRHLLRNIPVYTAQVLIYKKP